MTREIAPGFFVHSASDPQKPMPARYRQLLEQFYGGGWQQVYRDLYSAYLRSREWWTKRCAVWERDAGQCRYCGSDAQDVHHTSYDNVFFEEMTVPPYRDLVCVCRSCHRRIHSR